MAKAQRQELRLKPMMKMDRGSGQIGAAQIGNPLKVSARATELAKCQTQRRARGGNYWLVPQDLESWHWATLEEVETNG